MSPDYRCADCGKELLEDERPCSNCGKELLEDERPCSNCGSIARDISIELTDKMSISDNLFRVKVKNPDIPGTKYELTKKKKISGKSKRPAEENIIIDRTHQDRTVKKHQVREFNGKKWETVHNETVEFKAKRRKKTRF